MTHNSGINSLNTSLRRTVKIMIMIIMLIFIVFNSMVMAQQSQCNGVVVMNLTMVGQVWCTPHIYQGDYNGQPVGNYPVYYGPSNASQYWSLAGISSNQPILELVPPQTGSAGAMFWSGHYSGGPVTIMLVGTYTTGTVGSVADGFEFYLFIKPSGWSTTNPASNYSIPYYELNSGEPNSYPVEGSVIFPYAMPGTEYIVVQWNPWWSYGYQYGPLNGGDWNVWIGVGNGNSTPGITDVIDGVGSGAFEPNPGDLIMVEVTYNPSTNTISGYAEDLNTGQVASLSYSLNGNFTPPSPGQYTFGIAGNTGGWYANWGVMAVGEEGITYTPITISTNYTVTFIEEGLPTGAPWSVTVNGTTKTSTTNEITFTLPAGTYTFSASTNVTGYEVLNSTGTFTVSGNETLNILFASTNESSSFKIYSEYIEYFFTGFNEPNVFYVQAPNIDNSQPISVTGYITLNNESVSFTYNPSIGMWESNTIDMGQLPPGKGYLVVIAKYPSGQILTNNYTVTVVQSPALIVNILLLTHYAVLSASELYPLITNKTLYNTEASFEYKIIYSRVGLYNNTFLIVSNVDVKWNETHKEIEASYLSGEYEFGGFNIYVQFDFNSTGIVDISGKYHLFTFHGEVLSYPIDIKAVVGASGVLYVNYSNYSIELQSFSVFNDLSAAASFIIPTPWTWTIPVVNIKVGFIPVVSVAFSNTIYFTFTPTNNPQQEFLGLPVALSINGHAFIPFGITALFGGGSQYDDGGLGVYAWLQGVAGVGEYYQAYPSLSGKGGALVGELNAGASVSIIIISWSGSVTILGPGVIYKWGAITQSEISELEHQLEEAASEFQLQAVGASDWVNGSTYGLIASNLPLGYTYSAAPYNGSVYIYYTVTLPNGYAWINGVIFRGTYEYSAPLPKFNDLGVASPLLIQLPNGTLMMTWFAVPHGNYGLNNLTVILQGSVLEPNGTWGPVFNITNNGVALSVTSDGKYLYIIWEPELNLNYTNTELLVTSLTGQLITAMQLPNATALNGALNGNVAIQLLNGTYAVVNVFSRNIEPYIGYSDVGFVNGLFYAFSNDTLTIVNGTSKIEIQTPSEAYAWPSIINGKLLVIAYRPSTLSIYAWNGTALLSINNYTMPNFVIAKPTYSNGFIYITTLTRVMNNSDPTADLWNIILYASSIMPSAPTVSATIPPPSSYLYLRVIAPSYADWMIYSDASDNWYANYTGVGSVVFGPAYVGGPGTTVMFNVTGLGNCPSPSITYEPSNTLSLGYGPNYETVIINCEPMMNVALNITSGGGIIAIINEPGLGQRQLILNGPTTENLELPINTTITIYTWPYTGYTLSGIYVNGTEINYVMNMYGAYVYKVMVNSNQIIMINFNAK